jgi:hypothetical protein
MLREELTRRGHCPALVSRLDRHIRSIACSRRAREACSQMEALLGKRRDTG